MKIEILDDVAARIGFSEAEMLEILVVSRYKKQKNQWGWGWKNPWWPGNGISRSFGAVR